MRAEVKDGEQSALETLVEIFDWLDSLEPQGTVEIVTRSPVDQGVTKEVNNSAVSCSPGTRFLFFSFLLKIAYEPVVAFKIIQASIIMEEKEV